MICNKKHAGFSLVELLVIIAIIGVLASLASVQYRNVKDKAKIVTEKKIAKQVHNMVETAYNYGVDYVDKHWTEENKSDEDIIADIIVDLFDNGVKGNDSEIPFSNVSGDSESRLHLTNEPYKAGTSQDQKHEIVKGKMANVINYLKLSRPEPEPGVKWPKTKAGVKLHLVTN